MRVRKPAAAGSFYPSDPERLASYVDSLVGERLELEGEVEGLISPHAGYDYSGPIAGRVYSLLRGRSFKRVLLIGPSHFVDFDGLSLGSFDLFETPLGAVRVDREAVDAYARGRRWMLEDLPHLREHSLEVQLPFLQRLLGNFLLIPVLCGRVGVEEIEGLMEHFCNQETLFVVSSDLSHYYDDDTARRIDSHCHAWIERGEETSMNVCEACGKRGIEGALSYARKRGLIARLVAYGTSADTSGDRGRVVGYGGYVFTR